VSSTQTLIEAISGGTRIVDLAQPMHAGMPTSPNHPGFRLSYLRRHGDMVRPDGASAANELIVTGGHVGTHTDALAHVSFEGYLHGGVPVEEAFQNGRFVSHGIDQFTPLVTRGVFLDIPASQGLDILPAGYPIEVTDLENACEFAGVEIGSGDAVIIRTGWGQHFSGDHEAYLGQTHGVPGPTSDAARWMSRRGISVTGADSTAYEHISAGKGHSVLPAHNVLLVEYGINIIEHMGLEQASKEKLTEFMFVLAPLNIVGGTGSPTRPIAVLGTDET
jgi:kynurenine formamidase